MATSYIRETIQCKLSQVHFNSDCAGSLAGNDPLHLKRSVRYQIKSNGMIFKKERRKDQEKWPPRGGHVSTFPLLLQLGVSLRESESISI